MSFLMDAMKVPFLDEHVSLQHTTSMLELMDVSLAGWLDPDDGLVSLSPFGSPYYQRNEL